MNKVSILHQLRQFRSELRKSEQKVAEYVLANPHDVIHMRIVDLATESRVSEPTIVRFCRAIGFDSFQSLKLNLAQQLVTERSHVPFPIVSGDTVESMATKVINGTAHGFMQLKHTLDWNSLELAIDRLAQCPRIDFYGFGASGIVAQDAQQKFFRLQVATSSYSDPDLQAMAATTLTPADAVVVISNSGRNKSLLQSMVPVRASGASLIALCPSATPLATLADITLAVDVNEDTDAFTPMVSRLTHLLVLDILATGIFLRRGPEFSEHLSHIKQSLRALDVADHASGSP